MADCKCLQVEHVPHHTCFFALPHCPYHHMFPMAALQLTIVLVMFFFLQLFSGARSSTFTIINKCSYTVWPGVLSSAGIPPLSPTGFVLQQGESKSIDVPTSWSGRLWGRTLCTQDSSGKFTCLTGDCGSSTIECSGAGAIPPATLAEFTLNGASGLDFYDVSLVDGYNLPMMVSPHGGKGGNCSSAGCAAELNGNCPLELKVVDRSEGVACNSACNAFGDPKYCCSGAYSTPNTCKPSSYSKFFKAACPTAYSYAYDDGTSTFTCAGADYVITFCPTTPSTSLKTSDPMAVDISASSRSTSSALIAGAITSLAIIWQFWHLF